MPILDYGAAAWCLGNKIPKVDQIQERAARFYCSLPKNCSLLALIGETAWTPSVVRCDLESPRL